MAFFIFAALVVLLDQLFKYWVTTAVSPGEQLEILRGVIHITNIRNSGAAFGLFSDMRWVLIAISGVCIAALVTFLVYYRDNSWGKLGLAAVLGGALGNFIDRLALGDVLDMFEFEFVRFAIFNVADIFITVGGIVFCLAFIIRPSSRGTAATEVGRLVSEHTEMPDAAEPPVRRRRPPEGPAPAEPRPAPTRAAPPRAAPREYADADVGQFTVESILEEYHREKLASEYDDGTDAF
ncbi:MAG: signal peptidase II [Oscillospiraceae bacterium]|jgi:signal peptidase II|nr:signal peptidase II [Oscillospiraceae bacterium]